MVEDKLPLKVTTAEAARYLKVSRPGLLQMVISGRVRAERVGQKRWLVFRRSDLERLRAERERRTAERARESAERQKVSATTR